MHKHKEMIDPTFKKKNYIRYLSKDNLLERQHFVKVGNLEDDEIEYELKT